MAPITYDYLVLALGAQVNFFGTEGAAEHAFPMYTLRRRGQPQGPRPRSAGRRRTRTARSSTTARSTSSSSAAGRPASRAPGALAELYRANFATDYPSLPQEKARVVLVEAGAEIFAMFKPNLATYAKEALEKRTVEVMTGALVAVGLADARHASSPGR